MKLIGGTSVWAMGPFAVAHESATITADMEVMNGMVW